MGMALPCWFVHNALIGSVPGMISDVVGMTINGVMLARLGVFRPAAVPYTATRPRDGWEEP